MAGMYMEARGDGRGAMETEGVTTLETVREKVRELANIFLPDGFNPFVDIHKRAQARRGLRRLLPEHYETFFRTSPIQFIEFLFFGDQRMINKVTTIYGQG